jgi:hypothetical protein
MLGSTAATCQTDGPRQAENHRLHNRQSLHNDQELHQGRGGRYPECSNFSKDIQEA